MNAEELRLDWHWSGASEGTCEACKRKDHVIWVSLDQMIFLICRRCLAEESLALVPLERIWLKDQLRVNAN